jgi:tetratricopeptide (TPR) repeat protein
VNSTRPITSDKPRAGWSAPAIAALIVALGAAAFSVRDAGAALARVQGVEALASSLALQPGIERDAKLADAQTRLQDALAINAADAAAWRALARVRLMQGAAPELGQASPVLLGAAQTAIDRAARLDPGHTETPLLAAQISVARAGPSPEAVAALSRAYDLAAGDAITREARMETAFALWPLLDAPMRGYALNEACDIMRGASDGAQRIDASAVAAGHPALIAAVQGLKTRADCARPVAGRENSPPDPA